MSSSLDNWASCEVGEITDVVGGGTPPSKDVTNFETDGGIPWITPADLSGYKQQYITRGARNLSPKGFAACSAVMLPEGAVLFSSRAPVGYVVIAANPVCTNQGFKSFVLPNEIDSRFVYYYLKFIKPLAEDRATGTTFKELSGGAVAKLPMLLAPFNEQRRIADKLDAVLARVDACRKRLDRVPAILKRLRQSVLAAATAGQLTEEWREDNKASPSSHDLLDDLRAQHRIYWTRRQENPSGRLNAEDRGPRLMARKIPEPVDDNALTVLPTSWVWASGGEVVHPGAEIVYGIVQPGPKLREGVPYVRGLDIENGEILENQLLKTSQAIADRYSRASLQGGDVLLGIIRATKVAIVPHSLTGANITQGTARFRPSSAVYTKYLAIALEAPSTQAWLHAHYRGIDMPGLNLADVRRVPIPLPPLLEQEEIIRRVDTLLMHLWRLDARYTVACERVEHLTPATLAKAFRGKLVPQDPNDEPAFVLLERIRTARAAAPVKLNRSQIARGLRMTKSTPESLRAIIRELPHDHFTFDELRARVSDDYETLKDIVFVLLSETPPSITQVFDTEARVMKLLRVNE